MATTISVTKKTRDRIKKFGEMGDSYDSVLKRILDGYEQWLGENTKKNPKGKQMKLIDD